MTDPLGFDVPNHRFIVGVGVVALSGSECEVSGKLGRRWSRPNQERRTATKVATELFFDNMSTVDDRTGLIEWTDLPFRAGPRSSDPTASPEPPSTGSPTGASVVTRK